jgi:hypothetical protein
MADHHLITDLLPSLARLFFLGHLSGPAHDAVSVAEDDPAGPPGGGPVREGLTDGVSLSMVQKALLLGVGLQHRSVESLAAELSLPVSQVWSSAFSPKTPPSALPTTHEKNKKSRAQDTESCTLNCSKQRKVSVSRLRI